MTDRRKFIGTVAVGLLAAPLAAIAQQAGSARRIGILTAGVLPKTILPACVDELRERGWVEGQNLIFDRRGGDGNSERVPVFAAELVQMKLDVIVSFGAVAGVAIRNATTTTPIVQASQRRISEVARMQAKPARLLRFPRPRSRLYRVTSFTASGDCGVD